MPSVFERTDSKRIIHVVAARPWLLQSCSVSRLETNISERTAKLHFEFTDPSARASQPASAGGVFPPGRLESTQADVVA